jgi:hypothetical protein
MDRELDILMECAGVTLESAGYTLASNSPDTGRLMTEWRESGDERHRAFVTVLFHPTYGPGVSARLEQQTSRVVENTTSEGDAVLAGQTVVSDADAEGSAEVAWQTVPSTPESTRWQERYLGEVQECWRERREFRVWEERGQQRVNLSGSEQTDTQHCAIEAGGIDSRLSFQFDVMVSERKVCHDEVLRAVPCLSSF